MEIRDMVSYEGGIVLDGEDGTAFLLDRLGRRAMRLGTDLPAANEIGAFFANASATEHCPPQYQVIHVTDESLDDADAPKPLGDSPRRPRKPGRAS